ncbi:hypothetical protein JL101_013895 [Skermanella rosea]|uniref:hypothetical protein n=1 Tax=Skermanella rosea TaxID=1817965 RepID=UPI0019322414|nr:hypothetical protein [Skermanella rosea]UEM06475.1 hypothetical protein JL101_013895 [Skermanella rosea]
MAVGPVSRSPFQPLPDSRSLVPVTPARALPVRADAVERENRRRPKRAEERETETATAGTAHYHADPALRGNGTEAPHRVAIAAPPPPESGRGWAAPGSAPFVAQVLAQEVLKTGLYIEPWRQAISAYERASETAAPRLRYGMP